MIRSRWIVRALLTGVLIFGSYVRLAGLGRSDLNHDELIHYFTAQSLERGAGPELPSGELYRRGIDITRLSGIGARLAPDTELGARLPAALFGIINLVVFATIAWAVGGPWTAVVATLLLAVYPEAVTQSRTVRFYTYQLNFGLVALFATWQVVRHAGRPAPAGLTEMRGAWIWGGVAAVALLLAARVQVTTLSVLAGAGMAIVLAAVADLWRQGRAAWRTSAAVQFAAAGLVVVLLTVIVTPGIVRDMVAQSQHQALWAQNSQGSPLTYYWMFSESFPLLIGLAPLIFIVVAFRDPRLSVFLACWFGVPLILHSFLFPWKGERFVLLATPAFFLAGAVASVSACGALAEAIATRLRGPARRAIAGSAVGFVVLFALAATPALHRTRRIPSGASEPMVRRELWHTAATLLRELPGADTVPIGSSTPLAALHYFGRADFAVRRDALARPVGRLQIASLELPADLGFAEFPQGSPDYYSGVPVLTTPGAIRARFQDRGEVILVIDSTRWVYGDIEPALKATLMEDAPELCRGRCGALMAFRWTFDPAPSDRVP